MTNQSNEGGYNRDMMSLFFGEYTEENYFTYGNKEATGIYKAARGVWKGALKLANLTFYNFEEEDSFYVWDERVDIVQMSYGDYIPVSIGTMIGEISIVFLVSGISNFEMASSYLWICGVLLIMALANVAMFVWSIMGLHRCVSGAI